MIMIVMMMMMNDDGDDDDAGDHTVLMRESRTLTANAVPHANG